MESSAKIDFNVPNIFIEATKMLYDKYYLNFDYEEDLDNNFE